jgi:hypothetical protein
VEEEVSSSWMTSGKEKIMVLGNRMNQIPLCGLFVLVEAVDLL